MDTSAAASVRLPSGLINNNNNNNIVLFDPADSAATFTTSGTSRPLYDGKGATPVGVDVVLPGVDVALPGGVDVVLPGVDAVYHPPELSSSSSTAGTATLPMFEGTAPRTANQKDLLQEAFHADYPASTRGGTLPQLLHVRDDEPTLTWMQATTTTGSHVLKKLSKDAFRVRKASSSKKSSPTKRSKVFPWMQSSGPSLAPAPLNTTAASSTAPPTQVPYYYPRTKPFKSSRPKQAKSSSRSSDTYQHTPLDDRLGSGGDDSILDRKSSNRRPKNNHQFNLDHLFGGGGGDTPSDARPTVGTHTPAAIRPNKKSKSSPRAAAKYRTKHRSESAGGHKTKLNRTPDGDLMVLWHQTNPPIYIPIVPPPPPTAVPPTEPTLAPTSTAMRPAPAVTARDEEEPTVRFLRSFVLALAFQQTRIPSTVEINAVVALIGGHVGESLRRQTGVADLVTAVTVINTSFRLGSPFEFLLELQIDHVPSDIPTETLESIAEEAMSDDDTVVAILSRLPSSNVFRTTSSVSVSLMESVQRRSRVAGVPVAAAAAASGGLLIALLLGVVHMRRQRQDQRYRRLHHPNAPKNGTTGAATVDGTTFKSKSVGFSDDMISLSSYSDSDQCWKRQIYADCGGLQPPTGDSNTDDNEDAETPDDPLASPPPPQSSSETPENGDDATVDSYVPVAVVDLIRRFTPAQ